MIYFRKNTFVASLLVFFSGLLIVRTSEAKDFYVNKLEDGPPLENAYCGKIQVQSQYCSLRTAITNANASQGDKTALGQYLHNIYLPGQSEAYKVISDYGPLIINNAQDPNTIIRIVGDDGDANKTVISSVKVGSLNRIFEVNTPAWFSNVTLEGGKTFQGEDVPGGSLVLSHTNVTFDHANIKESFASGLGGAIALDNPSALLTISSSTFSANKSRSSGGAIYTRGSLLITDSTFLSNTSDYAGGAIHAEGDVDIRTTHFQNNDSTNGGALSTKGSGTLTIASSYVFGNYANNNDGGSSGGAVAIQYGSNYDITLKNSTFANNFANSDNTLARGGVLYAANQDNSFVVENCTFVDNYVAAPSLVSGAVFAIAENNANLTFSNNTLVNNTGASTLMVAGDVVSVSMYNNLITTTEPNACDMGNNVKISGYGNFLYQTSKHLCGLAQAPPSITKNNFFTSPWKNVVDDELKYQGGPTPTLRLIPHANNPAIDGGSPTGATNAGQNLVSRTTSNSPPDVGAYEYAHVCGDGIAGGANEKCDEGANNSNEYGSPCLEDCSGPAASCGDGQVDLPEETCDAGTENSDEYGSPCKLDCSGSPGQCGDGNIDDPWEQCDGEEDCSSECTWENQQNTSSDGSGSTTTSDEVTGDNSSTTNDGSDGNSGTDTLDETLSSTTGEETGIHTRTTGDLSISRQDLDDDGGCQCQASPRSIPPLAWMLLPGMLLFVRVTRKRQE